MEVKDEILDIVVDVGIDIVFLSPVPALIIELAEWAFYEKGYRYGLGMGNLDVDVKVMHNDFREKKELPNGKVISVVAEEGWELV